MHHIRQSQYEYLNQIAEIEVSCYQLDSTKFPGSSKGSSSIN